MFAPTDYLGELALAMVILLVVGLLLWRQGLLRRELAQLQRDQAQGQARIEQALYKLERQQAGELAHERESRTRQVEELQQRLLLQVARLYQALERRFGEMQKHLAEDAGQLRTDLVERFDALHQRLSQLLSEGQLAQQNALQQGLTESAERLGRRVDALTETTHQRLGEISGQVERRLAEGFEKSTETFNRVLEHLSRIDEAQKRITELSSNVVSLQEVLADKRSRGAFGEVQLNALVRNLMPESSFELQCTLTNGSRVDCLLRLPEPTGNLAIDAKFPLEGYRRMTDDALPDSERTRAASTFRQDIRKHIDDIADKYILPGETADGAMMFIPAESVFAEIHAHHPGLVEKAARRRVWLVSPTTMMAVLTTARAVLRDAATRQQVNLIQHHLGLLAKDFDRFGERMERLSRHIRQAHKDVDEVHVSARKISGRFEQIERVELDELEQPQPPAANLQE